MKQKSYLALGLMSGTSMDGVDASIIHSDGEKEYKGLFDKFFEYPSQIYRSLSNLRDKITKERKPNYNNFLLESLSKEFIDVEKKITLSINNELKLSFLRKIKEILPLKNNHLKSILLQIN